MNNARSWIQAVALCGVLSAPGAMAGEKLPLTVKPSLFGGGELFVACELLGEKTECKVDTGANVSSVRNRPASEALPSLGQSRYTSATGRSVICNDIALPSLGLGESLLENVPVITCPTIDARTGLNILGVDLLGRRPFRLNVAKAEIEFDAVPAKEPRPFDIDRYGHAVVSLGVFNRGEELPARAILDTGAGVTTVSLAFARSHPEHFVMIREMGGGRDTLGHPIEAWLAIATLRLGDRLFAAEYVMAIDFTAIQSLSGPDVNLILGQNVLSTGSWFLDFPNRRWSVE